MSRRPRKAGSRTSGASLKATTDPRQAVPRVRPRTLPPTFAEKVPGVSSLARLVRSVAQARAGRVPVGLLALLPVALLLDLFDFGDELAFGPVGMAISFVLETAFVLGVTGRPAYALGFAGIDLVPGLDVIPFATLTLIKAISDAWNGSAEPAEGTNSSRREGVIDV